MQKEFNRRLFEAEQGLARFNSWLRNIFGVWLNDPGAKAEKLIEWLEDPTLSWDILIFGKPMKFGNPESATDSTCYTIQHARELFYVFGDHHHHTLKLWNTFYERVAILLSHQPDVLRPGRDPDKVLEKLIELSDSKSFDALYAIYVRNLINEKLRYGLLSKLIITQTDWRLKELWRTAIATGKFVFIENMPAKFAAQRGLKGLLKLYSLFIKEKDFKSTSLKQADVVAKVLDSIVKRWEPGDFVLAIKYIVYELFPDNIYGELIPSTFGCDWRVKSYFYGRLYDHAKEKGWPEYALKAIEPHVILDIEDY